MNILGFKIIKTQSVDRQVERATEEVKRAYRRSDWKSLSREDVIKTAAKWIRSNIREDLCKVVAQEFGEWFKKELIQKHMEEVEVDALEAIIGRVAVK